MPESTPTFGGLTDTLDSVSVELERVDQLANGVARTLTNGFRAAIVDGKSFQSVLAGIGRSIADLALKAALKPLTTLTANALEGLFGAATPSLSDVTPFAKGGVLAAPAYFPTRGGLGLAGEAGPEAIMPLARGADGRLGVAGAASKTISISVNVQASDARSFVAAEAEVSAMLLRAVRRGTRSS